MDALRAACRPGATGAGIVNAWRGTGEPVPAAPLVHGVGIGVEPPVIGDGVGGDEVLAEGMVLALCSWVAEDGVGGWFERDLVLVGVDGPQPISRYGRQR